MRVLDTIGSLAPVVCLACNGDDINVCGNGMLEASHGEACDDDAGNADEAACTLKCELARCGDGLVQAGVDLCYDGDDNRDDGPCSPLCVPPTCGGGIVQASPSMTARRLLGPMHPAPPLRRSRRAASETAPTWTTPAPPLLSLGRTNSRKRGRLLIKVENTEHA